MPEKGCPVFPAIVCRPAWCRGNWRYCRTGVFLLELNCLARVDHQAIVIKKFLAGLDVTQGFKENAVAILLGFQIGFAGVINPLSGVAIVLGIDDVAVVQVKVEGMVGLAGIVGVAGLAFRQVMISPLYSNTVSPALMGRIA